MSIDVEDYFHVSAFDGVVPRDGVGRAWRAASCANTDAAAESLRRVRRARRRSSCSAGSPSGIPDLVAAHRRRGATSRVARLRAPAVYDQTPDAFRDDVRRAKAAARGHRRARASPATARRATRSPRSRSGRSTSCRGRLRVRLQHLPDPARSLRHSRTRRGIRTCCARAGGALVEVPPSTVRWGSMNLPVAGGGYFRILPYWWTRWGIARLNRTRAAAGDLLPAPLGDRSRPAAAAGRALEPVPALSQPRQDRTAAAAAADATSASRPLREILGAIGLKRRALVVAG